jgi:hypothetical protein
MDHLPSIPDEYLKAIGGITVHWNYLEMVVNLILIHLLGNKVMDERSHIIFAHTSFPQRMDILSALVEQVQKLPQYSRFQEYRSKVQPLLKAAQTSRNSIIHSFWGMKEGKLTRSSISARGSLKFSSVTVTLEEIEDAQKSIAAAYKSLSELIVPHAASPRKADDN